MVDEKIRKKIKTCDEVLAIIGPFPREKKVIMCHGTFDVMHPGHIRHLIYAAGKTDILVASLTCDSYIAKDNFRPFVPEELRAMNLAALEMVDYVIIDHEPTPLKNLTKLQPDYFAKGYEYVSSGLHPKTQEEVAVLESYGGEVIFTPGDVIYSSSSLINLAPPDIGVEKLISLLDAEGLTFADIHNALDKLSGIRVHVVGDTIVDSYTYTTMIGGQTKTPTISVRYENKHNFVGAAGIVAKHLRAAGTDVVFSTVLGDDEWKDFVLDDLKAAGIDVRAVIDKTRPTTNKHVIICGNHRLLKVDTLDNRSISDKELTTLNDAISTVPTDCVIFCDFRHGIFNPNTIPRLTAGMPEGVFRVADSQVASRWGNILDFHGFDLITPNEREARFALGDQDSVIRPLATKLFLAAKCKNLILKLGERGIMGYRERPNIEDVRSFFVVDSFAENVKDAVGSGDALLAYSTLSQIATGNEVIAAVLGSMAAAVACECDGNVPVSPDDVRHKLERVERKANYS